MSEPQVSAATSVSFEESTQAGRLPSALARRHLTKDSQLATTDVSPDLAALAAIAKPTAEKILTYLVDHPDSFYGGIVDGTGVPQASVTRHLAELEANGIIAGDIPVEARRGRATRYRIQREHVEALLARIKDRLLGETE